MTNTTSGRNLQQLIADVPQGWPHPDVLKVPERFVRKVVWDQHGPALDWIGPFCQFAGQLYGVEMDPSTFSIYNMAFDVNSPITPEQFNTACFEFARTAHGFELPLVWKNLPSVFKLLHKHGILTEFFTYTPGATDRNPITLKSVGTGIARVAAERQLQRVGLIKDPKREMRYVHTSAKAAIMAQEAIPLIIEDHPVVAMDASMHNIHSIMVGMPYNKDISFPRMLRLGNPELIAEAIIHFFDTLEAAGALL